MSQNHPRIPNSVLWHNGFHPITPEHLIDSLQTAKDNLDFSNYDCANYDRLREILLRYAEEHHIPLGKPIK